jgi:K+-sensing histidine kinase KdpD
VTDSGGFLRLAWRCVLTLVAVCALTWITYAGLRVNSSTAAFCYLLLILALAARAGLTESIAASVASVLTYNYFFLPPIGTLTISDPENWVALIVFLVTAITASHLSASARRRTLDAHVREQEMHRLYDFSRALMLKDPDRTLTSHAIRKVIELFEVSEACESEAGHSPRGCSHRQFLGSGRENRADCSGGFRRPDCGKSGGCRSASPIGGCAELGGATHGDRA